MADSPSEAFRKRIAKLDKAKQTVTSGPSAAELGRFIIESIVQRTRAGKAPRENGGGNSSLKPLSSSYKDFRGGKVAFYTDDNGVTRAFKPKRGGKHPDLDATTSPGKSNLTFTGQLLESLTYKLRSGEIVIEPSGNHDPLSTSKSGKQISNKKLAEYVAAQGRKFLLLSSADQRQIFIKVQQLIRKALG